MLKKINNFLNCVMGAFIGCFIGKSIFVYVDYMKMEEMHILQSAPWYVGIIIPGIVTGMVLVVCMIGKWIIKKKLRTDKELEGQ